MPQDFDEYRKRLRLSRYDWFDLFCIPQRHDNESELMRDSRESEIARQGEILRIANLCVVWLNDGVGVPSAQFDGTEFGGQ